MQPADVLYDDGVLTINNRGTEPGLALHGEIIEANYIALVLFLHHYTGYSNDIHLDLSGIHGSEIDLLRAMANLISPCNAKSNGANPHITLHATPHYLRTTLHVFGWDTLTRLTIQNDR